MELVYYWVSATNPSTISKAQGFNLCPEYDFRISYEDEHYFLEENDLWNRHPSVFRRENVTNLSVLVGENGAGKTTLLTSILQITEELDDHGLGLSDLGIIPFPVENKKALWKPIFRLFVFFGPK